MYTKFLNLDKKPLDERGVNLIKAKIFITYSPKSPNKYVHPFLNGFITNTVKRPFYINVLNIHKILNSYFYIVNTLYYILSNNFMIFLIHSLMMREETLSFFKYTFGVRNSLKYSFLIENSTKKTNSFY